MSFFGGPACSPGPVYARSPLCQRCLVADEVAVLRSRYGASAAFWATAGVHVGGGEWTAVSGMPYVDYNQALYHGPCPRGKIEGFAEKIAAARLPGLTMVTSEALASVGALAGRGWTCVGAPPFMVLELDNYPVDPAVAPLDKAGLVEARSLVTQAFHYPADEAVVGLPDSTIDSEGSTVWGLRTGGLMTSCVVTALVEDTVAVWFMATRPGLDHRGHGRRLLRTALRRCWDEGARQSVLVALSGASSFYRELGYQELEEWQVWSRPRWVFPVT